ncbi:TetR/AcrR family transcriptional regulator [Massilia sp. BJB1822]|uniref:TetR/AcrR family transcriptional regulator n=1 Tax=Massilia sp. BJB1822 TaxID=2744470 RepID=UPI001593D976|nr:TetR/AcrR family transcriptional regulator [Massilia sp. BJB1822]NVE01257.1 TetR/AcrR family transcriptional regulator [Massilia sp. BJB1822]
MVAIDSVNHRTRVGAVRRERMRSRLVESALQVFSTEGINSSVIQQVISVAEVSQGTFYNYFRTNEDLLAAISEELSNELMQVIEAEVGKYQNPAERIACGLRLYLKAAQEYPLFAKFVAGAALHAAGPNNLIYAYLPPHLEQGQRTGVFAGRAIEVLLDLIAGAALVAVVRLATESANDDYLQQVVISILCGLGLTEPDATQLAQLPLPAIKMAPDSLLERTTARLAKS